MKLIVGLGNPGTRYADTRHNAGFMALERLANRHGLTGPKTRFHAALLDGRIGNHRAMLMQPTTFMNRSGLAVGEAARFFRLPPEDLMVVVDDTALPVGAIRLRAGGSSGGHNGLEDIRRSLGTDAYPRLRVGVGEPIVNDRRIRLTDYVLGTFTEEQRAALDPALDRAADALEAWLDQGIEKTMTQFNTKAPEKPEDRQTQ